MSGLQRSIEPPETVCVVGGGIIGSWTALHLAEAGVDVTLIEQFPLPHTRGSSHGLSRAFRFLGDDTLDRLDYSLSRWQSLEEVIGDRLFVKTGLLNFGPPGDPYLEKYLAVVRDGGRPCGWLSSDDVALRYPMLRYPDSWGAAWDPNGGILVAQRCVAAVQTQFEKTGGRIIHARALSLDAGIESAVEAAVDVLLDSTSGVAETVRSDRVVVCAGPWTGKLFPQLVELLRTPSIPVTYWRDMSDGYSVVGECPILFNARLTGVYAFPSYEYPGLVKVLYHGGPESDPDLRDLADLDTYIEKVSRYVRDHLPFLDHRQPAVLEPCMYTMTPDEQPIIDRISRNVVVGCGFSGSGFKHSPATGWMLASLALNREAELPDGFQLGRYALSRFQHVTHSQSRVRDE